MTYRSVMKTPRLAAVALAAIASGATVDLCAASTRRHAKFGTDDVAENNVNALNIKSDVGLHAGGADILTANQVITDIAGGCAAKKACAFNDFNGLGSGAKKATCIGMDGVGSPSAPAKKATIGGSDSSYDDGKAPMALVARGAAKKAFGAMRRRH
jgi:hypothetical protein